MDTPVKRQRDDDAPDPLRRLAAVGRRLGADTLRPGEAEGFESQLREVVQHAKADTKAHPGETPALGRGASAAIANTSEQVAEAVRGKIADFVRICAELEREGDALIERHRRESLDLECKIEAHTRIALATRDAIRDAGLVEKSS